MHHSLPQETTREDMRCSFWVSGACFKRLLPYHIAKNCPTCNRVRATNINQVHVFFVNFFKIGSARTHELLIGEFNRSASHQKRKLRYFYRPHPKDGEGNVFRLSTTVGRGVPQSQVLSKVSGPRPFPGGTPVPGSFQGLWSQVLSRGIPQSQVLSKVSGPRSFLGDGYPIPSQDLGSPPLTRTGLGYSPGAGLG